MDKPKQERRNEVRRRRRALKRARITFKGRCATIDCTVLNLSDLGACLKVESPIGNLPLRDRNTPPWIFRYTDRLNNINSRRRDMTPMLTGGKWISISSKRLRGGFELPPIKSFRT
jgi:hypothetical protein